jgi:hypothetical protein
VAGLVAMVGDNRLGCWLLYSVDCMALAVACGFDVGVNCLCVRVVVGLGIEGWNGDEGSFGVEGINGN